MLINPSRGNRSSNRVISISRKNKTRVTGDIKSNSSRNSRRRSMRKEKEPLKIEWRQTIESLALEIVTATNYVVSFEDHCLKLSSGKSKVIELPLYDMTIVTGCTKTNNHTTLVLKKKSVQEWPCLFSAKTKDIEATLIRTGFQASVQQRNYDTLDFDSVINSKGDMTGLE